MKGRALGHTNRAVVTAIMGGYELPTEQPAAASSALPFICFTDDPDLVSETWSMRVVQPLLPCDPIRSARDVKLRLHRYLPEVEEVLWIDNSVLLLTPPEELLQAWLASTDLAIPRHSFRSTVADEFAEVALLGLEDVARIYEQEAHYRGSYPGVLDEQVTWTGMIARRMTPAVRDFGDTWMDHVLRYARRDQLSVTAAAARTGVDLALVDLDNHASVHHRWPVSEGRGPAETRVFRHDFIPRSLAEAQDNAEAARLRRDVGRMESDLRAQTAAQEDLVTALGLREARIAELESAIRAHEASNGESASALTAAQQQLDAVLSSRSFRLTAGPRRVAAGARAVWRRP
jgi:hypothetical protein